MMGDLQYQIRGEIDKFSNAASTITVGFHAGRALVSSLISLHYSNTIDTATAPCKSR